MILIVDDLKENILSLKGFLELHKFKVDTALSGEEALKKVLRSTYALIILDVQMPGMDGFEVAEAIAGYSKAKDTPIIFLSAVSVDKRFVTKGYASGGIDYVTKPFDPDILLLKVKTFYRIHEQKKELKDIQDQLRNELEFRKFAEVALSDMNRKLEQRVTERTEELRKSNALLEKKNTELQQFAYVSSHDLKEPLRKIQIFTNLIQDRYLKDNPDAGYYIDRVISASARMTALINDVLEYSQLTFDAEYHEVNLNQVVSEILADLDLLIQEKKAVVHVPDFPFLSAVPVQMRQLFQNLLTNALKFSRSDIPPEIDIRCEIIDSPSANGSHQASSDSGYCRIEIEDNGIGFEENYLDRIFTIFQRLHSTEQYEGTGIGLAIVKKIVENHHGLIDARSVPGKGSTFIIVLPLQQALTETSIT
jgi:signal transduction histidine kinase